MSTRITTGMTQRNILSDLNRVNGRLSQVHQKISSNKELTRPSDDPYNVSRAMALRTSMEATKQFQRNIQDAQGWQETAEVALSDITDSIARASVLVVEGASDTTPIEARRALAQELDQIIEGVKQNANATYGGRFVFGGTISDAAPYVGGDDLYHGSLAPVQRQVGPGVAMDIGISGVTFLGNGADGKLLQVLRDASAHLKAGDGAGLRSDIQLLENKTDDVLAVRALNGAKQNRLEAALGRLAEIEGSTLQQLSETEDVDIAKAMIEFSSQKAAYDAALRAGANIVQASLMDFLR